MKLQTQNILTLLPIFLGTLLIMGVSTYFIERQEMMWEAESEITAFAVALAEFINPTFLPNLENEKDSEWQRQIVVPLNQVFASGLLRQLSIYAADGKEVYYSQGKSFTHPIEPFIQHNLAKLYSTNAGRKSLIKAPDPVILSGFQNGDNDKIPDTMTALAPISDGRGNLTAIVAIETEVSGIDNWSTILIRHIFQGSLVMILIALGIAILLTFLIRTPIQSLTQTLNSSRNGRKDKWEATGFIREFHDLGNTYNTMVSVLEEAESRISRNLVQSEFFSRADLLSAFRKEFLPPITVSRDSLAGTGKILGKTSREFFDLEIDDSGLWWVVCRLSESCKNICDYGLTSMDAKEVGGRMGNTDLDFALYATCAATLVKQELMCTNPQRAFEKVSDLFEIEFFLYGRIDKTQNQLTTWRLHPENPTLEFSQQFLEKGVARVFHTFTGNTAERIDVSAQFFQNLPPEALQEKIINILEEDCQGTLIVIRSGDPEARDSKPENDGPSPSE